MSDGKTRKVRREFLIFDDDVDEGDADDWDDSFISPSLVSAASSQKASEVVPREDKKKTPREDKKKTPREDTKSGEVVQPADESITLASLKQAGQSNLEEKKKTTREKTNSDDPAQEFGKPEIKWTRLSPEQAMVKDVECLRQFFEEPKMVNEIAREIRSLNKDWEKCSKNYVAKWQTPPQPAVVIESRSWGERRCVVRLSRTE